MLFYPFQISLNTSAGPVKLSAWSTGYFRMDKDMLDAEYRDKLSSTIKATFSPHHLSSPMPFWVWLIEHPTGLYLIDTGCTSRYKDKKYKIKALGHLGALFAGIFNETVIEREEEVDFALQYFGYKKEQLKAILMTHLHFDHLGGLYHFPETKIKVHKFEWNNPHSFKKQLFEPVNRKPELVSLEGIFIPHFGEGLDMTGYKDLIMVSTPGHTYGHVSYLLKGNSQHYLIGGDIAYYQGQINTGSVGIIAADFKQCRNTYKTVLEYGKNFPTTILCSHDPNLNHM